ncbi:MAG: TolC family protein, partial [Planctomycetota bacterium JB042]
GIAEGEWFPDIQGIGTYQRSRVSENGPDAPPSVSLPAPLPSISAPSVDETNLYALGFDASWEIDVFGRVRRSVEAAQAELEASVEDLRDTSVSLFAEVALEYVRVRTLQDRLRIAHENVRRQGGTLTLTKDRFDADIAPDLDVAQAEANLYLTRSAIPTLESLLRLSLNRIAFLIGRPPGALPPEVLAPAPIPNAPEHVAIGLPANLVRQRPDVRGAERRLAAQTARIGVATADLYPRFSLTGSYAYVSLDSDDWLESDSREFSVGPSMGWSLFNGGRVRNNIKVQDERTEQLLEAYERAVLLALEETEDALVAFTQESLRRGELARAETSAERAVESVLVLYREGIADFQNVIDAEQRLFEVQDRLVASRGAVVENLISLYKALGGGWSAAARWPGEDAGREAFPPARHP